MGVNVVIDGEVYHSQPPGGIARTYTEILPRMANRSDDVFWTIFAPNTKRRLLPTGHNVRFIPQLPKLTFGYHHIWRRVAGRFNGEVKRRTMPRHAVWHSTYYTHPPTQVDGIVVSVYDMIYETVVGGRLDFKARCISQADVLICNSLSVRSQICADYRIPEARVHVIPLACSDAFHVLDRPFDRPKPFLLYVSGRADRYKNFHFLLETYAIWPLRSEVDLVVVGRGWSVEERNELHRLDLHSSVRARHNVPDTELCRLYNDAAALVYPSICEGFGLPPIEAMMCECQVVASDIPTTREVAGDVALYFDPRSRESLMHALDTAILHPASPSDRQNARLSVLQRYSWNRTAARILDVYRSVSSCTSAM